MPLFTRTPNPMQHWTSAYRPLPLLQKSVENPPPSASVARPRQPKKPRTPRDPNEPKGKPGRKTMDELMNRYRSKLHSVVEAVWMCKDPITGRGIGEGFIDRPSPKLYPDYDSVIARPIDLRMIKTKIDQDKYVSSTELGADLELMLNNAREYNEDTATLQPLIHSPMPLTSPRVLKERYGWSKTRTTSGGGSGALSPRSGGKGPKAGANTSWLSAKDAAMERQVRCCHEILEGLRNHKTEDGRLLCEAFLRAPSRRNEPEYYKTIKNPIDLLRIQQKVKTEEIESLEALAADMGLLIRNTRDFFKKGSKEAKDAEELGRVFEDLRRRAVEAAAGGGAAAAAVLEAGDASRDVRPAPSLRSLRSNSPGLRSSRSNRDSTPGRLAVNGGEPVHASVLEDFISSVMELSDDDGRTLCPPFRLLPSPTEFPQYYETIKDPIDLRTIGEKLRNNRYRTLNDLERDLLLMCKNAKLFNEPGSLIHKDSMTMRKFIQKRKLELMETGAVAVEKGRAEANAELLDELLRQGETEQGHLNLTGLPTALPPHLAHLGHIKTQNPPPSAIVARPRQPKKPRTPRDPNEPKGKPGRKTMDELMNRNRSKLHSMHHSGSKSPLGLLVFLLVCSCALIVVDTVPLPNHPLNGRQFPPGRPTANLQFHKATSQTEKGGPPRALEDLLQRELSTPWSQQSSRRKETNKQEPGFVYNKFHAFLLCTIIAIILTIVCVMFRRKSPNPRNTQVVQGSGSAVWMNKGYHEGGKGCGAGFRA